MSRFPLAILLAGALISASSGLTAPLLPPNLVKEPGELAAKNALDFLLGDLAAQRDTLVRIQRELVRRPGINPEDGGDGENAKALWIEAWLAAEGLPPAERVDCPDDRVPAKIRPNLILRHPSAPNNRPTLWIVAYLDNSPAGDAKAWTTSPTSLRVDGDIMHGLGVQDNNDAVAAALLLARSLHKYGSVAPFNFAALLVAGEKVGSMYGFFHVLASRPNLFGPDDRFLVLSYGEENGAVVEVAEKGVLFLKVGVRGQQAHSALPNRGKNALAAGAEFIARLPRLTEKFPLQNPVFEPPFSTFTPTKPEAPEAGRNQIPGEFGFYIDARYLHGYQPEDVVLAVEELAATVAREREVDITVTREYPNFPPSPVVPADAPEIVALTRAVKNQLGIDVRLTGIGGHSLGGDLRRMGYNAVVWRIATFQEHSADESMSIKANLDEAAVAARLLFDEELAASAPPKRAGDGAVTGQGGQ